MNNDEVIKIDRELSILLCSEIEKILAYLRANICGMNLFNQLYPNLLHPIVNLIYII